MNAFDEHGFPPWVRAEWEKTVAECEKVFDWEAGLAAILAAPPPNVDVEAFLIKYGFVDP